MSQQARRGSPRTDDARATFAPETGNTDRLLSLVRSGANVRETDSFGMKPT